jgi:uncharacterized membrane protein YphA (DoxX/SURF4 family)
MAFSTAQGLALIRAAFGLYFLVSAWRKTTGGWFTSGDGVTNFVERNFENAPASYAAFLDGVVLPGATTFSQLVVLGEWVAGLSLLFGLLTRLGAIVGMWLVLNFMVTKGLANDAGSTDRLFFVTCFAFAAAAAGLVWGLDGTLRPTLASNPVTRWLAGIPAPEHRPLEAWRGEREERHAA